MFYLSVTQIFRSIKNVTKVALHGRGGNFFLDHNRHPVTYTKRCSSICKRQVLFHGTLTRNIYVTTNATHLLVTEEYIS